MLRLSAAPVQWAGDPTTYQATVTGTASGGVSEESLWVRADVYDLADPDVDLAQYARVVSGQATLTLAPTPSWADLPGGGGIIRLQLWSLGRKNRKLDELRVELMP